MKLFASLTFLFFSISIFQGIIFSESLNLVEIQKKEMKRRKKTKKAKYVLTNSSLVHLSVGKRKISFTKSESEEGKITSEKKNSKTEKKKTPDPKTTEKYWKRKIRISNEKILKLEEKITKTQLELNKAQTDYLTLSIPSHINDAKTRMDLLSSKLGKFRKQLELANVEKENIYEEARKSNVPPGWLR